jgi:hypothetical protein
MNEQTLRTRGRPPDHEVGVLLIIGMSGSPTAIVSAIEQSDYVRSIESRRSGVQLELKLQLTQPATTDLLIEIVETLTDFEAKYQGVQSSPVPSIIFSLERRRERRRGFFLNRTARRGPTGRRSTRDIFPRTAPPVQTSVSDPVSQPATTTPTPPNPVPTPPASTPGESPQPQPELAVPNPITLLAKSTSQAILRSLKTETGQTFSTMGQSARQIGLFVSSISTRLTVVAVQPAVQWAKGIPESVSKVSMLLSMSVNYVFGSDSDTRTNSESDTKPKTPEDRPVDPGDQPRHHDE